MLHHAGGDGGVGDVVDENEAAGHAVLAVVIDNQGLGRGQCGESDLIGGQ